MKNMILAISLLVTVIAGSTFAEQPQYCGRLQATTQGFNPEAEQLVQLTTEDGTIYNVVVGYGDMEVGPNLAELKKSLLPEWKCLITIYPVFDNTIYATGITEFQPVLPPQILPR